ncbi:hypothetical protein L207DRAFT_213587 [Hyaloscypha variabilis F]|uniref:Uncharacterized protein n=1 Tax=Hyaloscypha variabilis (strain UAMH 11265 / GT02V1 / F) TaxID=1149755 RepID=A0A2J6S6P8_HYAVF|nr:hypothetical protein L207DRAFT_213587 [Hyaloscypha variabilis F]
MFSWKNELGIASSKSSSPIRYSRDSPEQCSRTKRFHVEPLSSSRPYISLQLVFSRFCFFCSSSTFVLPLHLEDLAFQNRRTPLLTHSLPPSLVLSFHLSHSLFSFVQIYTSLS